MQQNWEDEARLRARLNEDRLLIDLTTQMSLAVWNSIRWEEKSLDSAAQILKALIPSLDYRQDGPRGSAGDPFLESVPWRVARGAWRVAWGVGRGER